MKKIMYAVWVECMILGYFEKLSDAVKNASKLIAEQLDYDGTDLDELEDWEQPMIGELEVWNSPINGEIQRSGWIRKYDLNGNMKIDFTKGRLYA